MKFVAAYACLCVFSLFLTPLLAQTEHGFVITGTIEGAKDGEVVKLYDLDAQKVLDSTQLTAGKFVLRGRVEQPAACWLQCENEYATLMVEDRSMTFRSPLKNMFLEHAAKGGKEQALISAMEKQQYSYNKRYMSALDSLMNKRYGNDTERDRLKGIFETYEDSAMKVYVEFGKRHADSYYGQDILYRNRKKIPHDTLARLYSAMRPELKSNQRGRGLQLFLNSALAERGKTMIDFEVKTIDGQPFKLSSLKGKYIYL